MNSISVVNRKEMEDNEKKEFKQRNKKSEEVFVFALISSYQLPKNIKCSKVEMWRKCCSHKYIRWSGYNESLRCISMQVMCDIITQEVRVGRENERRFIDRKAKIALNSSTCVSLWNRIKIKREKIRKQKLMDFNWNWIER